MAYVIVRCLALVALLAMTPIAGAGQTAGSLDPSLDIDQYVHRSWTEEDGLPHNAVLAILQTSDGYIWVGTRGGLSRFDGVRFTNFTTANTPEFPSNWVSALAETPDSTLWIGFNSGGLLVGTSSNGVFLLECGRFRQLATSEEVGADIGRDAMGGRKPSRTGTVS